MPMVLTDFPDQLKTHSRKGTQLGLIKDIRDCRDNIKLTQPVRYCLNKQDLNKQKSAVNVQDALMLVFKHYNPLNEPF